MQPIDLQLVPDWPSAKEKRSEWMPLDLVSPGRDTIFMKLPLYVC